MAQGNPDQYRCTICDIYALFPTICPDCWKINCSICLNRTDVDNCCRNSTPSNEINGMGKIKSILEFLEQKCPLCDWYGKRIDLAEHYPRCNNDAKLCVMNCGKLVSSSDPRHLLECDKLVEYMDVTNRDVTHNMDQMYLIQKMMYHELQSLKTELLVTRQIFQESQREIIIAKYDSSKEIIHGDTIAFELILPEKKATWMVSLQEINNSGNTFILLMNDSNLYKSSHIHQQHTGYIVEVDADTTLKDRTFAMNLAYRSNLPRNLPYLLAQRIL